MYIYIWRIWHDIYIHIHIYVYVYTYSVWVHRAAATDTTRLHSTARMRVGSLYHILCTGVYHIHVCMHIYTWRDVYGYVVQPAQTPWLIHMCDMTHSYVWHDSDRCAAGTDSTSVYYIAPICASSLHRILGIYIYTYIHIYICCAAGTDSTSVYYIAPICASSLHRIFGIYIYTYIHIYIYTYIHMCQ